MRANRAAGRLSLKLRSPSTILLSHASQPPATRLKRSATIRQGTVSTAASLGHRDGHIGIFGASSIMRLPERRRLFSRRSAWTRGGGSPDAQALEAARRRQWHPPIAPHAGVHKRTGRWTRSPSRFRDGSGRQRCIARHSIAKGAASIKYRLHSANFRLPKSVTCAADDSSAKWIRLSRNCRSDITNSSLQMRGEARHATRLIVCPERAYQPRLARSRPRRGNRDQPVRTTIEPQLGLRRYHRSQALYRLGSRASWRRASSRSIRCTRSPIGSLTTPALICRIPSSTAIHFIWMWKPWRISSICARARLTGVCQPCRRKCQRCAVSEFVEYERVDRAEAALFETAVRAFPDRMEAADGASRGVRRVHRARRRSAARFAVHSALDEAIHRRGPDIWIWRTWPDGVSGPRSAATARIRAETLRARFCFTSTCSGSSTCNSAAAQEHARERGPAHRPVSRPGAGHGSLRLRSVGAPRLLRRRAAAWERRRTISRRRGRTGPFRRPIPSDIVRMVIGCSPNPSARTAGTAARCASIT